MSRISIPLDILSSRLNLSDRFASVRSTSLSTRFSNLKPVSEFLDFKRLSKPQNFSDVQSRVNYNLGYFSSNYAVVFLMLAIYSLLTNWTLLFVIILVVGGMYGIGKLQGGDLNLGFTTLTSSQLYTGLLIIAVPLGFFSSPITTVLWLIGFFWGGGLGSRPRSPKNTPLWGRQPGGSSRRREKERLAWEREASLADIYHDRRVEELGSSDDSDTQLGVGLNFSKKRFVSDPLQFTGIDMGAKPRVRRGYVYQESASAGSSSSDSEDSEVSERQVALRNKEEALVQSALARMRRAYEKGKTEVKLDPEELEALERRKKKMQAQKASEERRSSKVTVALAPPPEIFNARRRKHNQRDELAQPPPGMLVAGPDGNLVYAPFGQHPPQALSSPRNSTGGSSRPRSATNQSRNSNPPPSYYPQSPNGRHISDPQTTTQTTTLSHPSSSPRLRDRDPLPHEEGWTRINSLPSRQSSVSSAASSSRHSQRTKAGGPPPVDPFAYQVDDEAEENDSPPIPGQFVQSPTLSRLPRDVIYSSVRRTVPSSTSHTTGVPTSAPDATLSSLKLRTSSRIQHQEAGSAKRYQDLTSSSSESSDKDDLALAYGHGVKVYVDESGQRGSGRDLVGGEGSGSGVARKPVGSGNRGSARARKGRKGK